MMVIKRIEDMFLILAGRCRLAVPPGWKNPNGFPSISVVIDWVRDRWRLRLLANGLFWVLSIGILILVLSTWFLDQWRFIDPAIWLLRFTTVLGLGSLIYLFCVKPLDRQVTDSDVALYLEEHEPGLKSIIVSAVDARQSNDRNLSSQLVNHLARQAEAACRAVNYGHGVETRQLQKSSLKLGLIFLFAIVLFSFPPQFLRNGWPLLLMPWTSASQYSPYRIELAPGNIEVARGNDQLVSAKVVGFDSDKAVLSLSEDTGKTWRQKPMTLGGDAGIYESFLFDLNKNIDYYVESDGLRSEIFHMEVADIPAVSKISLKYIFPAYTLLEPKLVQGSGDISALRGTRVEVQILPTIKIPGGELVLSSGQRIELKEIEKNWSADITVEKSISYKVALKRAGGKLVDASPEYQIEALDDKHPSVSFVQPGRDVKVSMIEEPVIKVRAKDDQGIAKLDLVLSVNGEAEQNIKLVDGGTIPRTNDPIDAEHTVFLENLNLRTGDLISYYVRTEDRAETGKSRSATSDIFFFQVRPFRTDYRRSNQQGGAGGGGRQGGQQGGGHLSEQQRRFVVATFKMIRDRDKYSDERYKENLQVLATAQSRIRDRVEAIVRRIGTRSIVGMDKGYKIIVEELPLAAAAMIEVEKKLEESKIEDALPDAQVALKHLQRVDSAFRSVNIAMANRGGAGGRGVTAGAEELSDLFRLEMDKLRNQYEGVQRSQQQSAAQQIDEALERLRELAHRQQQEVERRRQRQAQQLQNGSGGNELALAKEVDEMVRRLERLSRSQPNPQLRQSINRLRDAAQAMRGAANSSASGGIAQARGAVESLREAQRLLDQSRTQEYSQNVERALRLAELARKKQNSIKQEVNKLDSNPGDIRDRQLEEVNRHKNELSEGLSSLQGELNSLTTAAGEEQPEAKQSLKKAVRTSREYRLQERIRRSREMILLDQKNHAIDNEIKIESGIVEIQAHIETALESVQEQEGKGLARSLERMRALTRELQFIRGRWGGRSGSQVAEAATNRYGNQIVQEELQEIAERADRLRRRLITQGVSSVNIDPVVKMLKDLSAKDSSRNADKSTVLYNKALSELKDLEYKLRKKLLKHVDPELLISKSNELPDGYEEIVADYFRKLSRSD